MNCPVCGKQVYYQSWHDEVSLIEYVQKCKNPKCGQYYDSWSYGKRELIIGKWKSGDFPYHSYMGEDDKRKADAIVSEFLTRIRYYLRRGRRRKRR